MLMDIFYIVIVLLVLFISVFLVARKFMKNEIKNNPPFKEQMIKTMMSQMGRTPSQKQVNQMMKQMNKMM